jgi:hypothetical protein
MGNSSGDETNSPVIEGRLASISKSREFAFFVAPNACSLITSPKMSANWLEWVTGVASVLTAQCGFLAASAS